jgi:hypothetical protein
MTLPVRAEVAPDEDVITLRRYGPDGKPLHAMSTLATISFDHARDLADELTLLVQRYDMPRRATSQATAPVEKYGITK